LADCRSHLAAEMDFAGVLSAYRLLKEAMMRTQAHGYKGGKVNKKEAQRFLENDVSLYFSLELEHGQLIFLTRLNGKTLRTN
jgi:hypothetical protein